MEDQTIDDVLLRHCNAVYNQNPLDRLMKGCILPFPKKGDLGPDMQDTVGEVGTSS